MALWLALGVAGTASSPKQLDKSWHSLKALLLDNRLHKTGLSSFMQDCGVLYCELIQKEGR